MISKNFVIATIVTVTVDETKFTDEFLRRFNREVAPTTFAPATFDEHMDFLATLYVKAAINLTSDSVVSGYGKLSDMGIQFNETLVAIEPEDRPDRGYKVVREADSSYLNGRPSWVIMRDGEIVDGPYDSEEEATEVMLDFDQGKYS